MFKDYIIQPGDTAESVTRKTLGDPSKQNEIISINNINGDLIPGTIIKIPTKNIPDTASIIPFDSTGLLKSLTINIGGKALEIFDNFVYSESLTGIRGGGFSCAYDIDNSDHVDSFKFGKDINIIANGEILLTGYAMAPNPYYEENFTGIIQYYKSAVHTLIRSDIAPNNFPLEFTSGQTLTQIIEAIVSKFNINVTFEGAIPTVLFDDKDESGVSLELEENVFSFLSRLCRSRGVILRDDENGGLIISKPIKNVPIAQFIDNETRGLYGIKAIYDYEKVAKNYAVFSQYGANDIFGETENSLFPINIFRNISINNIGQGSTQDISKWIMLRDLAKAIKIQIPVNDWYTPEAIRYQVGQMVQVQAPRIGIPQRQNLIIENVQLQLSKNNFGGILICTLPEFYTGETPTWLPMI